MQVSEQAVSLLSQAAAARVKYYEATEALEKLVGHEICDESLAMIIDFDYADRSAGLTANEASEILKQLN